jgi:predicted RNA-binding protein with TRAM domain
VTDGPREILTTRCPVCAGDGIVVSDATHALDVERKLRALAKGTRVQAFEVAVHPRVLSLLVGAGGARLEALEAVSRRRFFLVPASGNGHVHLDHVDVVRQGKLETLRPDAPVSEGADVEVKLVEVGLHDPTAGVAKLEGDYEVVVSGASKLVGKKVKASIGRALAGVAYATIAGSAANRATPITFEAEAEKPTRASRSKKETEAAAPVAGVDTDAQVEPEAETEAELVAEPDAELDESEADVGAADQAPKKKRTRRGTRGGRGRKKPTTADAQAATDGESAENGRPAPRIHVPPTDLEAASTQAEDVVDTRAVDAVADAAEAAADEAPVDGQPKRKRSRRGSRGGRKRRKPAAAEGEAVVDDVAEEVEPAPAEAVSAALPDGAE